MKASIEKSGAWVTISFTADSSKPPVKVELTEAQLEAVVAVLKTAVKASAFKFEMEL